MLLTLKAILIPLWFAVFFVGERLRPVVMASVLNASGSKHRARRIGRNLGLWLCNVIVSPLIVLPLSAWAATHSLDWRGTLWTSPPVLIIDIILLDFWIWWWHRANHEIRFLWRFHEVHHLDETLDASSALRFHFGEVILSAFVRASVVWLLAVPLATVIIFEVLILLSAIFHHSNLALPPKLEARLAKVIITPSIHWVHHHAKRGDTDSRYGTIFSFWDKIFGTTTPTQRRPDMQIGVEGRHELSFIALLIRPFRGSGEPPR